MTIPAASVDRSERTLRLAILWFQRVAGLSLFVCGILYWTRLIGIYPEPGWRFDLMAVEWRIVAPLLAVLCPVAGVGLWLTVSWGTVVWVLVAATEVAMHFVLPRLFGGPDMEVTLHLAGLAVLAILRTALWQVRRRRRKVR